jgi:hypothetical protein
MFIGYVLWQFLRLCQAVDSKQTRLYDFIIIFHHSKTNIFTKKRAFCYIYIIISQKTPYRMTHFRRLVRNDFFFHLNVKDCVLRP